MYAMRVDVCVCALRQVCICVDVCVYVLRL